VEDMMRRFANNNRYSPIYFKWNGRFVLTTFAGATLGPASWQQLRSDLESGSHPSEHEVADAQPSVSGKPSNAPLPVYFVPAFFWGGELPQANDIQAGLAEYEHIVDGAFYWGIAGVPASGHPPDQVPSSEAYPKVLHHPGNLYMPPIG